MKYAHGSGSYGCLYDSISGPFDTLKQAIDSAADMFSDNLSRRKLADMRKDLKAGLRYDLPRICGAEYVEIFEVDADWRSE